MLTIHYAALLEELKKPGGPRLNERGAISGHAAGGPFEQRVYDALKLTHPEQAFRQFEFLNALYSKNSSAVTSAQRHALIDSPAMAGLLNRGEDITKKWSVDKQFAEKQDDTADVIVTDGQRFELIDVKTRNVGRDHRKTNAISAFKLANMAKAMLESSAANNFDIVYIGIDWKLAEDGKTMQCVDAQFGSLFRVRPEELYINWAASQQTQLHVSRMPLNYRGSHKEWAQEYLRHYVQSGHERIKKMKTEMLLPIETLLANLSTHPQVDSGAVGASDMAVAPASGTPV